MNRRAPILRRLIGAGIVALLAAGGAACAGRTAPDPGNEDAGSTLTVRAEFPAGARFDYQLGGAYEPPAGTEVVVRDRGADPAPGLYSVCYINAFQTQPGERADWPEELLLHDANGVVTDPDWQDEALLDTSTPEKRAGIARRIGGWIRECASDGFQGVEFDNLDSFVRSGGHLSFADNLTLATELASAAHRAGLVVGQKNAAEHARELRGTAGFDFAVSEECAAYEECDSYAGVYGKAVIDIEYTDALPRSYDEMCADPGSPESMILRDRELAVPEDPGYVFRRCPGE